MLLKSVFRTLCVCALLALVSVPASGQSTVNLGVIEGLVRDATRAVLPGASVTMRNTGTGLVRATVSDDAGRFRVTALPLGDYSVTVELPGFKTLIREGVRLNVGETVTLFLDLEVATVEETITVASDAAVVETSRSVQAESLNEKAIVSLPINSRDFQDFATLTPTVIRERGRDTLNMGGAKGIDTNITFDGMDFNNSFFQQATGQPEANQFVIAQEAVQEFQVLANGFSAELGRSAGGVINVVTKSGTNAWHGSGFIFLRDEALTSTLDDAVTGQEIPKSDFSQQQFGGSFGGPIVEDKAHFFVAAEQQFFDSPFLVRFRSDVSQVPSLTSLFGGPVAGVDNLASLEGTFSREVNLTAVLGKVDVQTTENNTLSVRYNFSRFRGINFGASAGGIEGNVQDDSAGRTEDTTDTSHSVIASNTTVIRNTMINEFRFQYSFEDRPRFGTNNQGPEVDISGVGGFGRTGFLPITSDHTRWQFTDNFSYVFGDHDLKLGVDLNFTDTAQVFKGFSGGTYDFPSLDAFMAAEADGFSQRVGLNGFTTDQAGTVDFGQGEIAFYIQDVWKPKPGLTLNLGLRWEGLNNPESPEERFGVSARSPFNPGSRWGLDQKEIVDDWNNWAPRVGVAWDPSNDGRTVIRAGGGIFHSRLPLLILAGVLTDNGFNQNVAFLFCSGWTGGVCDNDPLFPVFPFVFPETGVPAGDLLEAALPAPDIFFLDPNFEVPEVSRFNVGFEHELVEDLAVGVDYSYAYTAKSQRRRDLNLFPPIGTDSVGRSIFQSRGSQRPDNANCRTGGDGGCRRFALNESTANARYNALVFSLKKRYSNNFQLQAYYTYSTNKSHDDNERSATGISPSQPENLEADWGNSSRDVRHRFVLNGVFDLPAGFQFSTTLVANSGDPINITSGSDDNGDGLRNDLAVIDNDTERQRLSAADQEVRDGLLPRNFGRQPRFINMDLRVTKMFDFERYGQLEFMFDLFNVFNDANHRRTEGRISRSGFGDLAFVGPSRQGQFGIRWRF